MPLIDPQPEPTFSDGWRRVADTRPRMSPHARITRQQFGPEIAYVIEDPMGSRYYRLSEPANFFLGLLDGSRTAQQAWEIASVQLGDRAPTQGECLRAIAQLQRSGLILGGTPADPALLGERRQDARRERFQRRTGKFVFPTIPILNPERTLARYLHVYKPLFSKAGFIIWLGLIGAAIVTLGANWRDIGTSVGGILDPGNLVWLSVLFIFIRAVHELGHAMACKAMGGRCTEIGLILIAGVLPLPYCDATSAWRMPETWRRVLVSSAGMIVELALASVAVFVWASTDNGTLTNTLAFNTMVISGVTTLVFNMNPLLRYDGYYILSDLAGSPNLAERSKEFTHYLVQRHAFGVRNATPPRIRDGAEAWLLGAYGVCSPPYRIFVGLTIVLIVASQYWTIGIVLALMTVIVMFGWPTGQFISFLLGSAKLVGRRVRAIGVTLGIIAALVAGIGFVPVPSAVMAPGVFEPADRAAVRTLEDGFIDKALVREGEQVRAGDILFVLRNIAVESELESARLALERARLNELRAATRSPIEEQAASERVEALSRRVTRLESRVGSLVIRAPIDGRFVALGAAQAGSETVLGRFLRGGTLLGLVMTPDRLEIRAEISDRQRALVFEEGDDDAIGSSVGIRVQGLEGRTLAGRITRIAPAASATVSNTQLTTRAGGEILLDPNDPSGERTLYRYAPVIIEPEGATTGLMPGQRVTVRIARPDEPIGVQVWRRIRRMLDARLGA